MDSGHIAAGGQYHFAMEIQAAVATVSDGDNIDVVCSTQDPSGNQACIASMLSLPQNKVRMNMDAIFGVINNL